MMNNLRLTEPVLLVGDDTLTITIASLLLSSGHKVELCHTYKGAASEYIGKHLEESNCPDTLITLEQLRIYETIPQKSDASLAIILCQEDVKIKKCFIEKVEQVISPNSLIAINGENISLLDIQDAANNPGRIVGLNWTEPAHTTRFLEIVRSSLTKDATVKYIQRVAVFHWNKDPYIVEDTGVRHRLLAAMIREAFYLVENGYATIEDIDRACRNDAGYYLSFAGNCRYMDLMGTLGYGVVMKDLNPELSKCTELPDFFQKILKSGGEGISNGNGFYKYTREQQELWRSTIEKFSYQIKEIIDRFPFGYK